MSAPSNLVGQDHKHSACLTSVSDPSKRIMSERAARYRREAGRIRERATSATTAAVRKQLLERARQLEELADGVEKAALQSG